MTKKKITSVLAGLASVFLVTRAPQAFAFTSQQQVPFTATATVGAAPATAFTFNIPQLLGQSVGFAQGIAFPGKNVVLPISIISGTGSGAGSGGFSAAIPANAGVPSPTSGNLQVSMLYQAFDSAGFALTPGFVSVPIAMQPDVSNPGNSVGTAVIPVRDFQTALRGGSMFYKFQLSAGSQAPIEIRSGGLSSGNPFQLQFVTTQSYAVGSQLTVIQLPDSDTTDGKTTLSFAPGALSGPGTLVVTEDDPATVEAGPGGLAPLSVFEFQLQGASLVNQAQLSLSYPANQDGTLIGSNGDAINLAPYWLQGVNWQALAPHQVDTTLHLVSAPTTHFSTFALFLSAGTGAADLRPRQRIITPNGDGINDTIDFSGIGGNDVHIFDVKGRRVRTLTVPNLVWDGRDDDGKIVESGVYLYQYTSNGDRVSGVIVVAK